MSNNLNNAGIADFDWEAYEKGDSLSNKSVEELTASYDKTLNSVNANEVVKGTVTAINKREVIVNIGYKSEGVIAASEFRYNPDLKVGDEVEVYIESQENKAGQLVLSHKKARVSTSWSRVNEALENNEIVTGFVKCRTKGGMIVDVFGIEAFLPGSQIDVKPIRDYDVFVNKTMEFKVVKINSEYKNVVVSHKVLIEAELEEKKKEIMSQLQKGQIVEGEVKNITSYGVFIDLGGVDGLIHITDLSWGRVNDPKEVVEIGQKLRVVILDFDDEKKRIALGLKQLTPHPWDSLDANLQPGDKVKGKVVVMTDYGAFVEIAPGVEGLIHVSEMSWSQHVRSAQDLLHVGDEVEAVILTLDRAERKMSLGLKQLKEDPWETILEKYPEGSVHTAKVRNFTNFGVFVEIEDGVEGLVHISDLSWTKKIKHPSEFTQIGSELQVKVLEVDKENRRLSLGVKQLEDNPWNAIEEKYTVGSVHEGTILEMIDKGAVIKLEEGVEGFATPKHLTKEDGSQPKAGDTLDFKVIEFNKDQRRIILSHSRTFEDAAKAEARKEAAAKKAARRQEKKVEETVQMPTLEKTTLGDLDALAALRDKLASTPVEKKAAPKKAAEAPAKKAEAPAKEAEAPAKEVEAAAKEAEAPAKEVEAPAKKAEAPAKEAEAPAKEAEAPAKEAETPAKEAKTGKK